MKSIAMKFAAIALAALFLLTAIAGMAGMIAVDEMQKQNTSAAQLQEEELEQYAWEIASYRVRQYALNAVSTAPEDVIRYAQQNGKLPVHVHSSAYLFLHGSAASVHSWSITDENGTVCDWDGAVQETENVKVFRYDVVPVYYYHVHPEAVAKGYLSDNAIILSLFEYQGSVYAVLETLNEIYSAAIAVEQTGSQWAWELLSFLEDISHLLPFVMLGSLLLFILCMVYLCWAGGRKKGTEEIRPAGLNALPLDAYALCVGLAGIGGAYLISYLLSSMNSGMSWTLLWFSAILGYLICLLPVIYIFALAAQIKASNRFWWRRSVIGFLLIRIFRAIRWLYRAARAVLRMVPAMWQWLLVFGTMVFVPCFILILGSMQHSYRGQMFFIFCFLGSLVLDIAMVVYGGWCFATIVKGAKRMAAGNLDTKIDTKNLYGSFRSCANSLNSMSDAALIAARQQLKSERMKTELITNVSHDIKTPLTSIINYVDLLQKPHTEEEGVQYLDVLSRQSGRMKKLLDDLLEMSKATTGNIAVEITDVNATEAVHQALGEFADKLSSSGIIPVFRQPEEEILMKADGRLVWRVMGNLLSNAVKYAMHGTRLYVDVAKTEKQVLISFKNISAEPLNISAEELMERFVRGDEARNTEGSGLGLNIAAGLMQVQGGSMELTVDGDLFKATLCFPRS